MALNVKNKGRKGEQDVAKIINDIYEDLYIEFGVNIDLSRPTCQRNQNQTAVGGCDLIGTCGYAIEVKRQETLNINTWWDQCVKSADILKKIPVLIYRQSRKQWRVVLITCNHKMFDSEEKFYVRSDISLDDFKKIFKSHAINYYKIHNSFN